MTSKRFALERTQTPAAPAAPMVLDAEIIEPGTPATDIPTEPAPAPDAPASPASSLQLESQLPDSAEELLTFVSRLNDAGQRTQALELLAEYSGYDTAKIQRIFSSDNQAAMMVVALDAGLTTGQGYRLMRILAGITRFREISADAEAGMRGYLRSSTDSRF